ncbi:secretion protein [Vibrio sinensis]|uniref:Secretion protein n=1 Tax=Vibrio sinensis TaxID=2302434 RepID=A0A3A6QVL6_9VIBR|nr:PAS factor family protein [Vibrio sinensis]RJX72964.1 secretion protein [Vibrio sinensis]
MKPLIYETLVNLANQDPEQHATIRQNLYEQLDLPFDKQLALYAGALGPASSGKLESHEAISNAVDSVIHLLETPEH